MNETNVQPVVKEEESGINLWDLAALFIKH